MTIDHELLDRPAAEGARTVAVALLADADEAALRLADPADGEALHDFRVALRRLRSNLRAWRPALGDSLQEKDERRLKRIARATNEARDAEVLTAWLGQARSSLAERYQVAAGWLSARLEGRLWAANADGTAGASARLRALAPRLSRRLAAGDEAQGAGPEAFGAALAALLRGQARKLRDALAKVSSAQAVAAAHRARIEGKRLRYLLEPLRGTPGADATDAVKSLKSLQDVLGELHDAHVARAEIAAARIDAAAERVRGPGAGTPADGAGLRAGLLALERLASQRVEELYGRLEEGWLRERAQPLLDRAYAVVAALEARAGVSDEPDERPRRRFLLLRLPEPVRWGDHAEVEKGWLPGDRVRECFGVGRSRAGETYFRSVSTRGGGRRPELSEDVPRATFEAFWPLTEGRRVHKRCHLPPGEPGWRFDEYLDRQLVLAVAEPGNEADPPEWMQPYVVREVTTERAYHDEALARRQRKAPAEPGRAAEAGAGADAPA
jgi:CHAD domain-containing protein